MIPLANQVFRKYGTCKMEVTNHIAKYFYQNDKLEWVEVKQEDI